MTTLDMNVMGPQQPESRQPSGEKTPGYLSRTLHAIREASSIAGLFRLGGAALMVGSLSVFLLQGVDTASDLQRYLLLLAQTLLLVCAGFGVGYLLKEPRGARVFFSLGLISIPANFAVMGAMAYSILPMDALAGHYPGYARWQSASIRELAIAVSAGLAVMVPISVFCFAIMARRSKWWLSAVYLATSATLLIPIRDSLTIAVISGVSALALMTIVYKTSAREPAIATREENFAKAILFLPPAIMLTRSASLYGGDIYLVLTIVTAVYVALRHFVVQNSYVSGSGVKAINLVVESITAVSALALASVFSATLIEDVSFLQAVFPAFMLFQLVLLALNIELARHLKSANMRTLIHAVWSALSLSAVAIYVGFEHNMNDLWTGPVAGTVLLVAGAFLRQRIAVIAGTLCLAIVLYSHGDTLISMMQDTGWLGMAIAGSLTIIAGSVLERFWPVIKMHFCSRTSIEADQDIPTEHLKIDSPTGGMLPVTGARDQLQTLAAKVPDQSHS